MGHFLKLHPRLPKLVKSDSYVLHTYNGGVNPQLRITKAYKQRGVTIWLEERVHAPSKYTIRDGVLRRDPATLPKSRRGRNATLSADARRARRQAKGLLDERRQTAYRSRSLTA